MPRRPLMRPPAVVSVVALGSVLLAGCGDRSPATVGERPGETVSRPAAATREDATAAFAGLSDLRDAWKHQDCAKIEFLTAWTESVLSGRACQAARKGQPVPAADAYTDVEFYLPEDPGERPWFAALARAPRPAYFVFVRADGRWRLGAGPIPVVGEVPELEEGPVAAGADRDTQVRASLVPTRLLAFLTDPAGVSGVRLPSGDPMRDLLRELAARPARAQRDRLSADVRLEGPAYALPLPDGGALVFHTLRLVLTQKPGAGRSSLAHPRYGAAAVRAFTGQGPTGSVTSGELLFLATRVSASGGLSTVGLRRVLADITTS
ncbi:hypothetical protein IMZ11_15750 [Microtetraspora sp. AC03309]|uniref:hypothetical protein n=1 Tax=Microtetraspora sp. AC03309 TaxID=2779376 RepID=UPI001E2AF182|nr:hypothetical protein [Microtetraspora sp. AC03309]MCC5577079.1 hypothetical protein [Microtetraspora sp. AC03309]